ncbi:gamma-glutamylcyclotransferase family protein [endosymbiont of Ridgeia piscesae]|jgi:hypothetical protein|uniref:AIG2-like family n=1 Tax=endosymbiont of Ridgeia piscesae TaxID=54398 RepID=A0A0T5YX00_9GAMM|nr:gamma-glutamylcyclotransferase family protein [endosymbiont of Ridgeia piscesae]KRT55112.1 AIG2-like family [endosymbiont of Ridgeia piscesae]KRT57740.1 AIG2-like family protein [endosymbiont of Ridgeia piscesae]
MRFYFAYGSNMSLRRMTARIPDAHSLGIACLPKHSLKFHKSGRDGSGKCDAYHTGVACDYILGHLYQISREAGQTLDLYEGRGNGYERKSVRLIVPGAGELEAFTYYATQIDAGLAPFDWYKHHVVIGAEEAGLSEDYRREIAVLASVPDPDLERHRREMAIYAG